MGFLLTGAHDMVGNAYDIHLFWQSTMHATDWRTALWRGDNVGGV